MSIVLPWKPVHIKVTLPYTISTYLLRFFFKILKFQGPPLENLSAWESPKTWILKHADESGVGGSGSSP